MNKITDINKAMSICFKNKVIVYPEQDKITKEWFIFYKTGNKKPYKINKKVSSDEIKEAVSKMYVYLANKM